MKNSPTKKGAGDECASSRIKPRYLALALLGALAAGAALYGFGALEGFGKDQDTAKESQATESERRKPAARQRQLAPPSKSLAKVTIPEFGRPEERKRYLDAMIAGDKKAIEVLEQAIAEAQLHLDSEPGRLFALERARDARYARLQAHRAALH